MWKAELEDGLHKTKLGDPSLHMLKEQLRSLAVSMETLRRELDKLKVEDFQDTAEERELVH